MRLSIFAAIVLATLAGCNATETTDPCAGAHTVTVSADAVPVIAWAPTCGAAWVTVQDLTAAQQPYVWTIIDTRDGFQPPVTYGVLPQGHDAATVEVQPQPLVSGHSYKVAIWRQKNANEVNPEEAGSTTFTP